MSAMEVLARFGTFALLRFVLALLVFVALHLVRLPILMVVRVLEAAMSRVDRAVTAAVSASAARMGGGSLMTEYSNSNDMRRDGERRAVSAPGLPTRTDTVVSWIGWHLGELTGVLAPAMLAVSVTPWAWVVSGVVGAGWTVHEVRLARQQAAIRAGRDLPVLLAADPAGDDAPPPTSPASPASPLRTRATQLPLTRPRVRPGGAGPREVRDDVAGGAATRRRGTC